MVADNVRREVLVESYGLLSATVELRLPCLGVGGSARRAGVRTCVGDPANAILSPAAQSSAKAVADESRLSAR